MLLYAWSCVLRFVLRVALQCNYSLPCSAGSVLVSQEEIEEFVESASMRLVTTFSAESSAAIFGGNIKVNKYFLVYFSRWELLDYWKALSVSPVDERCVRVAHVSSLSSVVFLCAWCLYIYISKTASDSN